MNIGVNFRNSHGRDRKFFCEIVFKIWKILTPPNWEFRKLTLIFMDQYFEYFCMRHPNMKVQTFENWKNHEILANVFSLETSNPSQNGLKGILISGSIWEVERNLSSGWEWGYLIWTFWIQIHCQTLDYCFF